MRTSELNRLLVVLPRLTAAQRRLVLERLQGAQSPGAGSAIFERPACPNCAGARIVRSRLANALQRHKCRGCRVTYNPLTGTPLTRLRHRDKWLGQSEGLREG